MICFVILHYMAINETQKCIESIKKSCLGHKYKIFVVDNGSTNNTGDKLLNYYKNDVDISIIKSQINLGFARGNNLGISEAKKLNPDFVVVLNSDIIINDENFNNKLYDEYTKNHFDILGPDIYCPPLGIHQNPKRIQSYTKEEVLHKLKKYKSRCDHKTMVKIRCFIKKINVLKKIVHKIRKINTNINYKNEYENVILHGSCVIFSNKYLKKVDSPFFGKTFMYMEMEILDYLSKKNKYKECYAPDIHVIHNHNASTNYTYKKEYDKVDFMNKCIYNSLLEFEKIMEETNE